MFVFPVPFSPIKTFNSEKEMSQLLMDLKFLIHKRVRGTAYSLLNSFDRIIPHVFWKYDIEQHQTKKQVRQI